MPATSLQITKLYLIVLMSLPVYLPAQIKIDSQGDKINGNVKRIIEYRYDLFADSSKNRIADETNVYIYYDSRKQVVSSLYLRDDTLHSKVNEVFQYVEDRLTEHRVIVDDTERQHLGLSDSIYSKVTYRYDSSKKLIKEYHLQVLLENEIKYRYDTNGVLIGGEERMLTDVTSFDGRPLRRKVVYKYDSMGYTTQISTYRNDSLVSQTTYSYDSAYHYAVKGNTISRYDNWMNLIEETSPYAHITNEYKYDLKGNWVEKTHYVDERKNTYTKRIITYY